jgi:hypothetical protein
MEMIQEISRSPVYSAFLPLKVFIVMTAVVLD